MRKLAVGVWLLVLWAASAVAQTAEPPRVVGILDPYVEGDSFNTQLRAAFRDEGLIDGRNVSFRWLYADGDMNRLPALAQTMPPMKLAAIIAVGDPSIRAARQANPATPIVAGSDDLVGEGHVSSLGRANGTVTGVSILASELNAKRLEVLKLAVPAVSRVGVLWDPSSAGAAQLDGLRRTAASLHVEVKIEEVRALEDIDRAFAALAVWHADGLNILASPLLHAWRQTIVEKAARVRLPAIYQWGETAEIGGLMSYGPTHAEILRAMARQLDRLLKGTKLADIPVEQPTQFRLVVNAKTARELGIAFPPSLLASADEVIE